MTARRQIPKGHSVSGQLLSHTRKTPASLLLLAVLRDIQPQQSKDSTFFKSQQHPPPLQLLRCVDEGVSEDEMHRQNLRRGHSDIWREPRTTEIRPAHTSTHLVWSK